MVRNYGSNPGEDIDIVIVAVREVLAIVPCTDAQRAAIERRIDDLKHEFGGRRHYVPKGKKHPDPQTRSDAFELMKDARVPIEQITSATGMSRSALYHNLKKYAGK